MVKVFGSKMCPDCIEMQKAFDDEKIPYEYHDITANLQDLKAFLRLRDSDPIFEEVRKNGMIGIPVVQAQDGSWTFEWQNFTSAPATKTACNDGVCGISKSE